MAWVFQTLALCFQVIGKDFNSPAVQELTHCCLGWGPSLSSSPQRAWVCKPGERETFCLTPLNSFIKKTLFMYVAFLLGDKVLDQAPSLVMEIQDQISYPWICTATWPGYPLCLRFLSRKWANLPEIHTHCGYKSPIRFRPAGRKQTLSPSRDVLSSTYQASYQCAAVTWPLGRGKARGLWHSPP